MSATHHIRINNNYTSTVKDLQKKDTVEMLPEEKCVQIPQWQIEEIRESVKYYKQHPEELISWEDAQKMIKTD
jgi:hypothetical protein